MIPGKVWVVVEDQDGEVSTSSMELMTAARGLFEVLEVLSFTASPEKVKDVVSNYGARLLYLVEAPKELLAGNVVADAVVELLSRGEAPKAILFAQSYTGRDALARLSVRLDLPVLTNVINLVESDGDLEAQHAIFGGEQIVNSKFTHDGVRLFAVRPKSFTPSASPNPSMVSEKISVEPSGTTNAAKVVASHTEARQGPKLDEASVVVSGGRGLGKQENYEMVEELAQLLKGAPGASRAIVDSGWVPYAYQVGQTGKTVKPELYIAIGISGATQHMVGMKGAKNIIAINKDKDAPIFQIADLGVVGDATKVVPQLIEAIKSK